MGRSKEEEVDTMFFLATTNDGEQIGMIYLAEETLANPPRNISLSSDLFNSLYILASLLSIPLVGSLQTLIEQHQPKAGSYPPPLVSDSPAT